MGLYMYITEEDRKTFRSVDHKELNEVFQKALALCPLLMIEENRWGKIIRKGLFKKPLVIPTYDIYYETPAFDGSAYQACYVLGGEVKIVNAYLLGVIEGVNYQVHKTNI